MASTQYVYDRGVIMRRAWAIARQRREDAACKAHDLDVRVIAGRIVHNKPLSAFIAEIPLDLGAAQKRAWAEARGYSPHDTKNRNTALIVLHQGSELTPLRRQLVRAMPLLLTAVRWLNSRLITSRAA